jgi:DTW domain-containing protein YfiP
METRTKVVVLVHRREVHKTTGTARLVPLTLAHGELRTVGLPEDRVQYEGLEEEGRSTLLLSPVAGAVELTRELVGNRPATLVVPDGNWRQARRMATNEAPLARMVAVRLPEGPARRFELRKHPQAERLSTFEAIARALGILEGPEVQQELERILHLKVERTLDTRGRRKDEDRA